MTSLNSALRVLYVEDDPVDTDLARRELYRAAPEMRLEVAPTVAAAMELLADAKPPFDVVLSDLTLPDGNGLEILSHVRARDLPLAVVIITGSGDQEAAVAALKAGADDYLTKSTGRFANLPLVLSEAHCAFQARLKRQARPMLVLYAEPNPFDVDLTRRHLAQYAPYIQLEAVGSGEEILQRLADPAMPPCDVLLLDYRLPGINALEVVKTVRRERGLDLPVVLVTGHGNEDVAVQALRLGVDDYLVKNDGYLQQLPVIFEKLEKQAELNRSENRYRTLFENNQAAILVVDPESGEIVDANPAAANWYGWSRQALCRRNINDIIALTPVEMKSEIERVRLRQEWRFLLRHRRADESVRDVEVFSGPVTMAGRPLLYSIIHDITEKKLAEEELKKSEVEFRNLSQEFNALLDAIPDTIMLLDQDLTVLWANRAATENIVTLSGASDGRHCYSIWYHRTVPCRHCPVSACFASGNPIEETVTERDGKVWNMRAVPLKDEDEKVVKVIVLRRDITEQKNLEKQYLHAQKMESIGTMAGGVAHDFNNVLTVIVGLAQLVLMQMKEDDPHRRQIGGILEAAERATHLTRELLLFSRKQESERQTVDLNEVITKMEKFLHRLIGEDITLHEEPHQGPLPILADTIQLEQVVMNLAVNARDAMPRGGEFKLRTEQAVLDEAFAAKYGSGKSGVYAILTVEDTGIGMDEETRQRIFEPFFSTKEVGKGTGLGLSVVYGIVKQHEGFVTVESKPGKGSSFRIYLPLTAAARQELTVQKEQPIAGGTETILLAEDSDLVRDLVTSLLTDAGYTVITAGDGEEAVAKFRESAASIQLLLLDLIMPKMNGKEASDEIRKMKPEVKTIFASGYAPDITQQKAPLDDGSCLITKPIAPRELLRTVRNMLDSRL